MRSDDKNPGQFVRFRVNNLERFDALRALFYEIKKDKEIEEGRNLDDWVRFIPDDVKSGFYWPSEEARNDWEERRGHTPIAIPHPRPQLSQRWNFYRIFEAFEDGEYGLVSCEMTGPDVAEMRIDTWAYPYGGLGCMIALAEAFGFEVLGVNECGVYESREDLLAGRELQPPLLRRWWEIWKRR